jgi:DNA-binding CsgD family transcriptional regulator
MVRAVEELEKVSALCGRIDFPAQHADLAANLLEPIASFLGAETATFRWLSFARDTPGPDSVVSLGIPDSVNDAYLTRYFKLDPARRLLQRRLKRPLFADPKRYGEWSQERATPAALQQYREEFLRYRREFLLPNNFYHHVGFCFQDLDARTLLFDFHRAARSPAFGRLELARAHIVALYLHAKAVQCRHLQPPHYVPGFDSQLSTREFEVAEAVALGLSNKEVATCLDISVRTVENHMRSIFAKLRVSTRTRMAAKLHEAAAKTAMRTRSLA